MKNLLSTLFIALFLTGCGGGGSSEPTNAVSGSITAPSGGFSFNPPGNIKRFFASLIGSPAIAKIDGLANVGAGVSVKLIKIDADGTQVGAAIATAVTDSSGNYTLNVPAAYTASSSYAIVATGTSDVVKSMWEGSTVNIDPGSNATMNALLESTTDLSTLDTMEIISARELIEDFSESLVSDLTRNLGTTSGYIALLEEALKNDEEASQMLANKAATGKVCGIVTNASNTPISNIRVNAATFNTNSSIATTKTTANGSYCFNAPIGKEIMIKAANQTTKSDAASEYFTDASPANGSGTKCHLAHCAEMLTVTTDTTANFKLIRGGRVTGTITGDGVALKKIKVIFRNALTRKPAGNDKTNKNGVYTMNLAPGEYIAFFQNNTNKAFGSSSYTTNSAHKLSGKSIDRNFSEPILLAAGDIKTANGELAAGGKLAGLVKDNNGDPVEFAKLRIYQIKDKDGVANSLSADRFHTNKKGIYKANLPFGTYTISARGRLKDGTGSAGYTLDSSHLSYTNNFDHQTNSIDVALKNSSGVGIGSITASLRNVATGARSANPTLSDGTTKLYVPDGEYNFYVSVNDGTNTASCNWNNANSACEIAKSFRQSSDKFTISAPNTSKFTNITMPVGFTISGTVKDTDGNLVANAQTNVRVKEVSDWKYHAGQKSGGNGQYTFSIGAQKYVVDVKLPDETRIRYYGTDGNGCLISAAKIINSDFTNVAPKNDIKLYDCSMETTLMPHTISGIVTGSDGSPRANARVWIYDSANVQPQITTYTNSNGEYTIKAPDVTTNTYRLKATYWTVDGSDINLEYKGISYANCPITGDKNINFNGTGLSVYTEILSCNDAG